MDESKFLDAILNAVAGRVGGSGGMATGSFVLVAEVLDADGKRSTLLAAPETQATHATLGLLAYGTKAYDTEAYMQMLAAMGELSDEED